MGASIRFTMIVLLILSVAMRSHWRGIHGHGVNHGESSARQRASKPGPGRTARKDAALLRDHDGAAVRIARAARGRRRAQRTGDALGLRLALGAGIGAGVGQQHPVVDALGIGTLVGRRGHDAPPAR